MKWKNLNKQNNPTVCEIGTEVKTEWGQEKRIKVFYLNPLRSRDDRPFWVGFFKK